MARGLTTPLLVHHRLSSLLVACLWLTVAFCAPAGPLPAAVTVNLSVTVTLPDQSTVTVHLPEITPSSVRGASNATTSTVHPRPATSSTLLATLSSVHLPEVPSSTLATTTSSPVATTTTSTTMSSSTTSPRRKRAALNRMINMTRLSNPCSFVAGSSTVSASSGPTESPAAAEAAREAACGASAVRANAASALRQLNGLMTELDPILCRGMNMSELRDSSPNLSSTMTTGEKMKEIYKSLVPHVAYMHAIAIERPSGSEVNNKFNSCSAQLQTLQCSLQCYSDITATEHDSLVVAAGGLEIPTVERSAPQGTTTEPSSEQLSRECVVIRYNIELLNLLLAQLPASPPTRRSSPSS